MFISLVCSILPHNSNIPWQLTDFTNWWCFLCMALPSSSCASVSLILAPCKCPTLELCNTVTPVFSSSAPVFSDWVALCSCCIIPYSGYFSGSKILVVFVVERRTTKFLPTKQYRNVPGCGLVYRDHENFSTNWPKIHSSRKFYLPKNTRYTVVLDFLAAHAGQLKGSEESAKRSKSSRLTLTHHATVVASGVTRTRGH